MLKSFSTKPSFVLRQHELAMVLISAMLFMALPAFAEGNSENKHNKLQVLTTHFPQGRLAFTYTLGKRKDIYVANLGTQKIAPLYASKALDEYPDWSPDGKFVAFYSDIKGDREIFSIGADGTKLKRLTKSRGIDEDPDWSPDGTRITFHSERLKKGASNIFVMNADGSNPTALTEHKRKKIKNTVPRWSPRGDEMVYSTNRYWPGWDLMLYSSISGKSKLLTSGVRSFCRASWNPDGSILVYSYGSGKEIDLWLQTKGTAVSTRLTDNPGREYDAVWHEGGEGVFFAGEYEPGSGRYGVYYINLKTKVVFPVLAGPGSIRHISWTPLPEIPPIPEPPTEAGAIGEIDSTKES